jgi:hypothetical protein
LLVLATLRNERPRFGRRAHPWLYLLAYISRLCPSTSPWRAYQYRPQGDTLEELPWIVGPFCPRDACIGLAPRREFLTSTSNEFIQKTNMNSRRKFCCQTYHSVVPIPRYIPYKTETDKGPQSIFCLLQSDESLATIHSLPELHLAC